MPIDARLSFAQNSVLKNDRIPGGYPCPDHSSGGLQSFLATVFSFTSSHRARPSSAKASRVAMGGRSTNPTVEHYVTHSNGG
jgi:hypothetical protein